MRLRSSFLALAAVAVSAAFFGYACGSSGSGSSDLVAKCKPVCEKEKTCNPELASAFGDCTAFCTTTIKGNGTSVDSCKNPSAAAAKLDQCGSVACSGLDACLEEASAFCGDTSGTGGASGATGGASGATGGTSGTTGGTSGKTGGTTGSTGGTSGATGGAAGGTSGAGDCNTVCGKTYNCCVAVLGSSSTTCASANPATLCANASTAAASVSGCQSALAQIAQASTTVPAACK